MRARAGQGSGGATGGGRWKDSWLETELHGGEALVAAMGGAVFDGEKGRKGSSLRLFIEGKGARR